MKEGYTAVGRRGKIKHESVPYFLSTEQELNSLQKSGHHYMDFIMSTVLKTDTQIDEIHEWERSQWVYQYNLHCKL